MSIVSIKRPTVGMTPIHSSRIKIMRLIDSTFIKHISPSLDPADLRFDKLSLEDDRHAHFEISRGKLGNVYLSNSLETSNGPPSEYAIKFMSWNVGDGKADDRKRLISDMCAGHDLIAFQESKWVLNGIREHLALPQIFRGVSKEIFQRSFNLVLYNSQQLEMLEDNVDLSCVRDLVNCTESIFNDLRQRIQVLLFKRTCDMKPFLVFNIHMRRNSSKQFVLDALDLCLKTCFVKQYAGLVCGDFNLKGGLFEMEDCLPHGVEWLVLDDEMRPGAPIDAIFTINVHDLKIRDDRIRAHDCEMLNLQTEQLKRQESLILADTKILNHPYISAVVTFNN